jgi:hypothetical protein
VAATTAFFINGIFFSTDSLAMEHRRELFNGSFQGKLIGLNTFKTYKNKLFLK